MPTYEYRCKDCGEQLEVVQAFSDDPLSVCPHCQGTLKKVFHSVGIAFKGSGFYKNDSRSTSSSASSGSSGGSDGTSGDSGSSSSSPSTDSAGSSGSSGSGTGSSGPDSSSTKTEAKAG